jgi:hypothetical protein
VALTGESSLSKNIPQDFQVTVTDIKVPGTYEGSFDLLIPGQKRSEALTIPLNVVAKSRPGITPEIGTAQIQLNLVHCRDWKWNDLRHLFLLTVLWPDAYSTGHLYPRVRQPRRSQC